MTEMPEKNSQRDENFVDGLLDSALARYAQAEPRPGLEGRLLARLRSEPASAAFSWRWLPMAAAAAMVLAAVLYFAGSRESNRPQIATQPQPAVGTATIAQPESSQASAPLGKGPSRATRPVARQASAQRAAAPPSSPRRGQFPTPAALSAQEQALVRFVNQSSPRELQVLADKKQEGPIPNLQVEPLEISPVAVEGPDSQ